MIFVLDVSAAVEIILQRDKWEAFSHKFKDAVWVVAPDLYIFELSNVLWKYHKAGLITHSDCVQYVEDGINLVDDYFNGSELWKEALGEGIKNNHSIYDLFYAVLARRNDATLLTNDHKLVKLCKKLKIDVFS